MDLLWQQLRQIRHYTFEAQSQNGSQMHWHERAKGTVCLHENANVLDFHETLSFANGRVTHDQKRWKRHAEHLEFWHWRHGQFEHIFTFIPTHTRIWQSQHAYHCAPDHYHASLKSDHNTLIFNIHIIGARKNEILRYEYAIV